jgi:hypothetical protein
MSASVLPNRTVASAGALVVEDVAAVTSKHSSVVVSELVA